jgi:mannose-6-phosphate isomerase-like protein (cupin superfamily)
MDDLVSAIESSLRRLGDAMTDEFLALWPARPWQRRQVAPQGLPVLQWLETAAANSAPEYEAIANYLCFWSPDLAWAQTYSAAEVGGAFLDRYGWTELIGTRGPIASASLAAGFLLLGPETEYPAHHHVAEEVYVPISGQAQWRRGGASWRVQPTGTPIYHASGESHAMRTMAAPLLALYLWRSGDLAQKSEFDTSSAG